MKKIIRTYFSRVEADIAAGLLTANKIESEIESDDVGSSYPNLSPVQGVKLTIEESDYKRAEEILEEVDQKRTSQSSASNKPKRSIIGYLIFASIGFLLGAAVVSSSHQLVEGKVIELDTNKDGNPDRWEQTIDSYNTEISEDLNYDGNPDVWYRYLNDRVVLIKQDLNYDGKVDLNQNLESAKQMSSKKDRNFDGKFDEWGQWLHGVLQSWESDDDFDGRPDTWGVCELGVDIEVLRDTSGDGTPNLKEVYEHGVRIKEEPLKPAGKHKN